MIALLLRCYPARWRARYGDEFAAVLEERPLGPFDVADVLLGAIDAHLHLRGLGAASEHRKGFAMSLRIGGYAAIVGSLVWVAGYLVIGFDGTDDAWPSAGIMVAGLALLLVGIAGLSAFQARRHPKLIWAAFLAPAIGTVLTVVGLVAMGVTDGDTGWGLSMLGLLLLFAGSGLFALASWRTGMLSQWGTVVLGTVGLLVIPGVAGILGAWAWEPVTSLILFAMLVLFAAGWLLTGLGALRADRPAMTSAGGAA